MDNQIQTQTQTLTQLVEAMGVMTKMIAALAAQQGAVPAVSQKPVMPVVPAAIPVAPVVRSAIAPALPILPIKPPALKPVKAVEALDAEGEALKAKASGENATPDDKRAFVTYMQGRVAIERAKNETPEAVERAKQKDLWDSMAANEKKLASNNSAKFKEVIRKTSKKTFKDGSTKDIAWNAIEYIDGNGKVKSCPASNADAVYNSGFDAFTAAPGEFQPIKDGWYGNITNCTVANGAIEFWQTYKDKKDGLMKTATFNGRQTLPIGVYSEYLQGKLGL